jgi:hypothetical protein
VDFCSLGKFTHAPIQEPTRRPQLCPRH